MDNISQSLTLAFCKPNQQYWLGCDPYGSSMSILILKGFVYSFFYLLLILPLLLAISLIFGYLSNSKNQIIEQIANACINLSCSFPNTLAMILLTSLLKPNFFTMIFAIIFGFWGYSSRFARSLFAEAQREKFLEGSVALGANSGEVFLYHILPNVLPSQIIYLCNLSSTLVIAEASISFLGISTDVKSTSLGRLIAFGRDYMIEAPHILIESTLSLFIFVFLLQIMTMVLRKKLKVPL